MDSSHGIPNTRDSKKLNPVQLFENMYDIVHGSAKRTIKECSFGPSPDVPPPPPPGLLPEGLDGLPQEVLHLVVGDALVGGALEERVGALAGEELPEDDEGDGGGHGQPAHDDARVPGRGGVLLGLLGERGLQGGEGGGRGLS